MEMKVYIARDVDHCFGVKRAIHMTRQALVDNDDVFILGDLIHNRAVTAELEACGLRTVDDFQGCASGTMVVRAHGLPRAQLQAAHDAGLNMIDATCQIVYKHQDAARELEARGCQVIIIGDKKHPEIQGVLGALERPAVVIDSVEELRQAKLDKLLLRKVGVTFQTTHSFERCLPIVLELIGMAKEVQVINTFCRPVRNRQLGAVDLAERVDVMIIVGSRTSHNTVELKHLCEQYNPRTLQIESADELEPARLQDVETVGLASGLSTPREVVEAVQARLLAEFGAMLGETR
jgi:(E)-4-hydroxy-3-methyl-but-2-enyl pyrophosphate reductase